MSYTKLFSSIVTSTIWTEDANTCKVWVTMLAIADKNGEVHASIPGLAQIAGMALGDTEAAIVKFLSPDKYSRTPDDEGRRIEPIDGGWILLNHAKYRAMASKDEEKSASAKRQAAFRERQKRNGKVTVGDGAVTGGNYGVTENRDIADTDTKSEAKSNPYMPTSPEAIKISNLYHRRLTTPWSPKEIKSFKALSPINAEDLDLLCRYEESEMAKGDNGKHRRDLATFLNNFHGEVDRARAWKNKPDPQKPKTEFNSSDFRI